jgi:hypothetical protein
LAEALRSVGEWRLSLKEYTLAGWREPGLQPRRQCRVVEGGGGRGVCGWWLLATVTPNSRRRRRANSRPTATSLDSVQPRCPYQHESGNPLHARWSRRHDQLTRYRQPFPLTETKIDQRAWAPDHKPSLPVSARFEISPTPMVAQPTITPIGGSYTDEVQVTLACQTRSDHLLR